MNTAQVSAIQARILLFQRKLSYEDYGSSIPGVPELDGQLGILELKASDTTNAEKLARAEDGQDEAIMLAALVAKSLVLRETKERLFSDTDIEGIADFGLSVLKPIAERIKAVSGLDANALETAKKNSETAQTSDSASSSTVNSEAAAVN